MASLKHPRTKNRAQTIPKTGASFARGSSNQSYSTPTDFIDAVKGRFGVDEFDFDLAASTRNAKARRYYTMQTDALERDWTILTGHLWLNPPYDRIEPWAAKCASTPTRMRRIYFLVPAAVGSNWFAKHVDGKARVYLLNGRLSFDGKHPYPKDCVLALFGPTPGYEVWRWKEESAIDRVHSKRGK